MEGLDCYSHPLFSDVESYRCGFLGEDGLIVLVLVVMLVAMAVGCCEGCCESQEDGLYEHSELYGVLEEVVKFNIVKTCVWCDIQYMDDLTSGVTGDVDLKEEQENWLHCHGCSQVILTHDK